MPKLFCIGEALIDFIPMDIDTELKNVSGFLKKPGGAPANVSAAAARLGNDAAFLGKLGKDAFGDFLVETISASGVDTSCILRTDKANTSLAFVSLKNDGNREFSFYRKPGADMLLESSEIQDDWFNEGDILQFCTVSLSAEPVRSAHIKAIEAVKKKNGVIVFDPNLRFPLWDDKDALKKTCLEFLSYSDVVKISDEEL
ncbi:MAG: carbohydrate kinase, partial [Spirochaetales bacterium]|nr:carbohydrate kinase [Spirochaetales bacterium]